MYPALRRRLLAGAAPAATVIKWVVIVLLAYLEWRWDAPPHTDRVVTAAPPATAVAPPAGGLMP